MNIAVIPARGGSKRIPRKNIKEFCGKPMIAWPIEAAKKSELFDRIIVSTDDDEIAKVAKSWGAEVPFVRPVELSDDYSGTSEVMAHAVSWMSKQGWKLNAVCCMYATSVFFTVDDLVKGFNALNSGKWSYTFSVTDLKKLPMVVWKCSSRNILKSDPRIYQLFYMMQPSFIGENRMPG